MFFSLLQTFVCVLLVNTGLYALHLTGNSGSSSSSSSSTSNAKSSLPPKQLHKAAQFNNAAAAAAAAAVNPFQSSNARLNEELADLAQLERERLMVLGLAKQTAEESIGYHGRPIITGRIKMHPAEDMDSEYSAWLAQQARNVMFGNVVDKPMHEDEDYDSGGGGGGFDPLRSPNKYDYGRIVQPFDREREREFESPHNLDLDDFMELEPVSELQEEDMFPDMDGYAYLEELMAEENKERMQQQHQQHQQHQHYLQQQRQQHNVQQQMPQFPGLRTPSAAHHMPLTHADSSPLYQNHEPEDETKQAVKEFLEKEQKLQNLQHQQQQQQQQQQAQQFNTKYRNNIRMQQKWLRKRNQQKELLTRNIFGQKNAKLQQQQPAVHHFKTLSSNKLSLANSEATATTRINKKPEIIAQQPLNAPEKDNKNSSTKTEKSSSSTAATNNNNNNNNNNNDLHTNNHKRSGLTPASLASAAGVTSPHSLASQLMLRTARGQRQYDVPQIECPTAMDGMERFACPTPDVQGRYRCIDDHVLCDGFIDCPEGEDEDRRSCMFYKTTKAHLDVLADALLRWARGR